MVKVEKLLGTREESILHLVDRHPSQRKSPKTDIYLFS